MTGNHKPPILYFCKTKETIWPTGVTCRPANCPAPQGICPHFLVEPAVLHACSQVDQLSQIFQFLWSLFYLVFCNVWLLWLSIFFFSVSKWVNSCLYSLIIQHLWPFARLLVQNENAQLCQKKMWFLSPNIVAAAALLLLLLILSYCYLLEIEHLW